MALKRLEGSDYQVKDGSTDIRGWKVMDQAGEDVGMIDTLLFDPEKKHVVYAVLDLQGERRVLLPVSMLAIEQSRCRVVSGKYDRARLAALRPYTGGDLDETEETSHYQEHVEIETPEGTRDYSGAPFRHEVPSGVRSLESGLGRERELTFSGTEPSAAEIAERERLEAERRDRLL